MDNVFIERLWRSFKHEDIYLKGYGDDREAKAGIASWIAFYDSQRPHQARVWKRCWRWWRRTGWGGASGSTHIAATGRGRSGEGVAPSPVTARNPMRSILLATWIVG